MFNLPDQIIKEYDKLLTQQSIELSKHNLYLKWVRFYLDFCHKYNYDSSSQASLPHFIKKLQEKNQSLQQQNQASHVLVRGFDLLKVWSLKERPLIFLMVFTRFGL